MRIIKKAISISLIIIFSALLIGWSKNNINKNDIIEISSENLHPVLYDKDGLKVAVEQCEYSGNEKDDAEIMLSIKNESEKTINIDLINICIGDTNISSDFSTEKYIPGDNVSASYYFPGEEINAANLNDFKEIDCIICISIKDKELLNQKIVIKRDAFIEINSELEDSDEEILSEDEEISSEISSVVFEAYNEAISIDDSELVKSEYKTTYHGITINSDELEWLESGAIYRSLAKKLEGFDMEISKNAYDPNNEDSIFLICGFKQATWDEMKPYVDKATLVVTRENTLYSVMSTFQNLDCVIGDFDFNNNVYNFEITDLEKASNDLGISQKMLGYTLAMLDEYSPTIEFGNNSCKCIWF